MNVVNMSLKKNGYKIIIGHKILSQFGNHLKKLSLGKETVVITNPTIRRLHGKALFSSLKRSGIRTKIFEVPDGERAKSAKVAIQLLEKIACYDGMKNIFIIAFGGGVVGDLAGYVAAVYKRGVPYVQVPTTLLAQIDSAIGGKVAIDLSVGKNLVGAFYQPKMVFSDVSLLKTLNKRQVRNGLAEAVKYGIINDKKLFEFIAKHHPAILNHDVKAMTHLVHASSRIKTKIVLADEFETKGKRTILNFGHTIGHAIEAAGDYRLYHHGEAIALGMRVACDLSHQLGMLSLKNVEEINAIISDVGLPQYIKKVRVSSILSHMKHDKKFTASKNRFVLAKNIGKVSVVTGVPLTKIKKAIKSFM